jgi:uncharacterized membrane protein
MVIPLLLTLMLITSPIGIEEFTSYSIHLLESGDALFVITERIPLQTSEELKAWEVFSSNYSVSDEYEKIISRVVQEASNELGRNMSVSAFNSSLYISPGIGKSYGVIEYSFLWRNFSVVEGNKLLCGDVFIGGLYISSSETLTIYLPDGFSLLSVSPPPDVVSEEKISWYGPKEFQSGSPAVVLEKNEEFSAIFALPLIAVFLALLILKKWRMRNKKPQTHSDEDLIMELLKESGGEMLQSDIVRRTGFSKSKVSMMISKLQKEGKIEKVMKGRENLIRLKKL